MQSENYVKIVLKDAGVGIPANKLARIMEPFSHSDPNPHIAFADGEGKGLGLTIAKSMLDAHEGELEIESEEGLGTTVAIIIPK